MNTQHQTDAAAEGLNLSDPRHQLIYALRCRVIALQKAQPTSLAESTPKVKQENTYSAAGTTGFEPLTAGTQPGQSRDATGTKPGYPGHPAGTDAPETNPAQPRHNDVLPVKPRRKITESPLTELSLETQAQILHLLETLSLDAATLEITSKPPYGMGIETSRSSLHRFHQSRKKSETIRRRELGAAETAKLIGEAKSAGDLSHTAIHLIAIRLLETASAEDSNPGHLLALSKAIDRLRAVEHSERRLRLAEAKALSTRETTSSEISQ